MTSSEPRSSAAGTAMRVVAAVVGGLAALLFLATAWVAVRSRFGPPEADMHGYGLLFGAALAVMSGLVAALILPLAMPPGRRGVGYLVSLLLYLVCVVGLAAAVVSA